MSELNTRRILVLRDESCSCLEGATRIVLFEKQEFTESSANSGWSQDWCSLNTVAEGTRLCDVAPPNISSRVASDIEPLLAFRAEALIALERGVGPSTSLCVSRAVIILNSEDTKKVVSEAIVAIRHQTG